MTPITELQIICLEDSRRSLTMSAVAIPIVPTIQLKRILYATDLSQASRAALPIVSAIARKYRSQVCAAYVWSPLPYSMVPLEASSSLQSAQENDARGALEVVLHAKELSGIPVTAILECGDAATELSRVVQQHHIDLAVLSTHGRTGFRHLLMGSVAEELFRSLPCPVLTVGPNISKRFAAQSDIKEVLFPTDLSRESQAVFPYLAAMAAENESHVTLLHVVPREDHRHPSALDEAEFLRAELRRTFCPQLDPRCTVKAVVEAGDPAEQILAHARADHVDLIGFGVRKAREISTHFRNTVTYKVVLQAECPVLTSHFGDG
jgi:nucleotide-binding universal stress UspA family protein